MDIFVICPPDEVALFEKGLLGKVRYLMKAVAVRMHYN